MKDLVLGVFTATAMIFSSYFLLEYGARIRRDRLDKK